jgi:uncharacterized membrane protein YeaQ/YmgE (transglycosylase-associated protein family)
MAFATFLLTYIDGASLFWLIIVGLIAGVLASTVMHGGYGIVGDTLAGIAGSFIGNWLLTILGIYLGGSLLGEIIVAFIGACILIAVLRFISGKSGYRKR